MQNFCQFEVDFHFHQQSRPFISWIPGEALLTLTGMLQKQISKEPNSIVEVLARQFRRVLLFQ